MAVKHEGNKAPYLFDIECRWCCGKDYGVIYSRSFGSCVGLVLYSPKHKIGVVAHYSGSLGMKASRQKVANDTQEILRAVCPISPGVWKAWVFGGTSLFTKKEDHATATVETMTKPLIVAIRQELKYNKYFPINLPPNAPGYQEPEMTTEYVGHAGVDLDVATGKITWYQS
ncbi:MAG: hypothetical protein QOH06_4450 [Acidobacteriota bacterium]|jgi:hypothetical protein|nr:hypothetical protein [Acidobacteriota bacterium]